MASANGATARAAASTENVALKRMVIICLGCTVFGVQVLFICSDGRVWIVKERLVVKEIKQGCKTQCQSVQAIEPQEDATTHSPVPAPYPTSPRYSDSYSPADSNNNNNYGNIIMTIIEKNSEKKKRS